jgi:hypothetical protein
LCRRLRDWTNTPIIILSADGSEDRKVEALNDGADDYTIGVEESAAVGTQLLDDFLGGDGTTLQGLAEPVERVRPTASVARCPSASSGESRSRLCGSANALAVRAAAGANMLHTALSIAERVAARSGLSANPV